MMISVIQFFVDNFPVFIFDNLRSKAGTIVNENWIVVVFVVACFFAVDIKSFAL